MKNCSVKIKITLLLTLLMATLAGLLLTFMVIIGNSVATKTAQKQLEITLRSNLKYVEVTDSKPLIQDGFSYSHNGISTLVYSQNQALIAGQIPVGFQAEVPFENGKIQLVESGDTSYFVLDLWLASDWNHGVWFRGLTETPNNEALTQNLLIIALIALPLFILMAASGSYHIARRSFRPLEHITATAEAINEAKDLSGRIGLPPGKDEFSRLASDFDQMFERLEKSFEAEKQFTSDASHELRTPISVIQGACEYAKKYDETPEDRAETIDMIHRQAQKMSLLVSQLLSMTRMEQGTENIAMEPLDFSALVQHFFEEHFLDSQRISLQVSPDIWILANEELLERLIRNLVENAFKYSEPNCPVHISLIASDNEALLSVKDQGIGIAPEEQDQIWQRFYQVDSSRSNDESSGLGLSMVKQIANLHHGFMSLESNLGMGSTFTLHLPLKKI